MKLTITIRHLLTALIVWQIWLNSHWSVALFCTLVSIRFEMENKANH